MLYSALLNSCESRNQRSSREGAKRKNTQLRISISAPPISMPSSGATKMNTVVRMMPGISSGATPALAMAAPIMPPISACEPLLGMPQYQVITFQAMAPISAPKMTASSTKPGPMMPLPTVAATFGSNSHMAMKLNTAAQITAW